MTRRPRVRAPELHGRGWLNTGGASYSIADFRGRFLLLDFWAFCCVNCLHVLDELRPLEEKYAGELVVVGVHSPKFVHEADPEALAVSGRALRRGAPGPRRPGAGDLAGLHRPRLADAGARRPRGLRRRAVRRRGARPRDRRAPRRAAPGRTSRRAPCSPATPPTSRRPVEAGDLRFPAKVVALPGGGFLVADAGHHCSSSSRPTRRPSYGGSAPATADSSTGRPTPRGSPSRTACACCRPRSRPRSGTTSWSPTPSTTRCAACGCPTGRSRPSPATAASCSPARRDPTARCRRPWDVAWWQDRVWVAMAGIHQLWTFDPRSGAAEPAAGTTNEGLRRRAARRGLAGPDLRARGDRRSAVARRQRDLEPAVRHGRRRAAPSSAPACSTSASATDRSTRRSCSTRSASPSCPTGRSPCATPTTARCRLVRDGEVSTLATGLAEPSGAVVDGDHLLVVESAAHRLTRVPLGAAARIDGFAHRTQRPADRGPRRAASRSSSTSPLRPARRSTTGSARPPSSSSPRPRRRCSRPARVAGPTCGGWSRSTRRSATASCTSPPGPPRATRTAARAPPATCTSRTGACRCGSPTSGETTLVLPLSGLSLNPWQLPVDDLGTPVPLDRSGADRVVSLVPSLTEAVAATRPEALVGRDGLVHPPRRPRRHPGPRHEEPRRAARSSSSAPTW